MLEELPFDVEDVPLSHALSVLVVTGHDGGARGLLGPQLTRELQPQVHSHGASSLQEDGARGDRPSLGRTRAHGELEGVARVVAEGHRGTIRLVKAHVVYARLSGLHDQHGAHLSTRPGIRPQTCITSTAAGPTSPSAGRQKSRRRALSGGSCPGRDSRLESVRARSRDSPTARRRPARLCMAPGARREPTNAGLHSSVGPMLFSQ